METRVSDTIDYAALDRLGDEIAELSAHLEAATARLLDLIREFDARGGWNSGFSSCAAWLSWRVGLDLGAARERVRVARALATLPRLAQALDCPDRRLEPIGVRFGHALQAVEREERAGGGAERDEGVAGAGYAQLQAVASRLSNEPGDRSLARRRGQPLRAAG